MRPNTMSSGSLTTPRHSPVITMTLSSTLVKRPKNPFQSPGTHQRGPGSMVAGSMVPGSMVAESVVAAAMLMTFSPCKLPGKRGDERLRASNPAEYAALRLDHPQPHFLKFREVGTDA